MPSIDPQKLIEKVRKKGESKRGKVTLYLDRELFKEFGKICGEDISPSRVLEEVMRDFVESSKGASKKKDGK